jgi:hypothetical protein
VNQQSDYMDHFCSDTSYVCPIPASGYSQEMTSTVRLLYLCST